MISIFFYSSVSEYEYLLRWSVKQFNLNKISKWFWLTLVILIREISVFVMVSPTAQICMVNFRLMGTSGWQNVKKAAYKVTEPEDISVSSQQEEKYSFFSTYDRVEFRSNAYFLSLYGLLPTTSIFHLWNRNILLPQVQSTSSNPTQINLLYAYQNK